MAMKLLFTITLCVAAALSAESRLFGVMQPCPKNDSKNDECQVCISNTDQRPPETARFLYKYLKSVQVGGSYNNFTWSFKSVNGVDPNKINITLFAWSQSNPNFGNPIPGCCNVSLNKGGCLATECRDGRVFFGLSTEKLNAAYIRRPWGKIDNCTKPTIKPKFIYTCPSEPPEWMKNKNAKCLRYDSSTGETVFTNSSKKWEGVSWTDWMEDRRNQIARELTQMCTFLLPKKRVITEGDQSSALTTNDNILFQREVFHMTSLHWTDQGVSDHQNNTIQCEIKAINFSEVLQLQNINNNQNMYMCIVLWSGKASSTDGAVPPVKCMAQNESDVPTEKPATGGRNETLIIIFVSLIAGFFLILILIFLCLLVNRKMGKFIKKTEKVPESLNRVMKDEKNVFEIAMDSSEEGYNEKETSPFEPLSSNMYRSIAQHI